MVTKSWRVPPSEQMRCAICQGLFLIADEHARLDPISAKRVRMHTGTLFCGPCWYQNVVVDHWGQPFVQAGHA